MPSQYSVFELAHSIPARSIAERWGVQIRQQGSRGWACCPLHREHHSKEHDTPGSWLADTLHLTPIPLTAEIGKVYGLTKRNLRI